MARRRMTVRRWKMDTSHALQIRLISNHVQERVRKPPRHSHQKPYGRDALRATLTNLQRERSDRSSTFIPQLSTVLKVDLLSMPRRSFGCRLAGTKAGP